MFGFGVCYIGELKDNLCLSDCMVLSVILVDLMVGYEIIENW